MKLDTYFILFCYIHRQFWRENVKSQVCVMELQYQVIILFIPGFGLTCDITKKKKKKTFDKIVRISVQYNIIWRRKINTESSTKTIF